ncbi:Nitroreductase-like protein [Thelonectria olida]|uniref:Nitroreductase-like protein n=1 Tax=Thelonectria olida TaxID=1576542 RepID=A0A9P8VSH7_9HYPO|nr:Nitroreductase-like protein [Thelonectria olida]
MTSDNITTDQFLKAAKYRRTVYGLKDASPVPDSRIEEIVKEVLSFSPSSYNTQPGRISLILGEKHKQFWDIAIKEAEPILTAAGAWEALGPRFHAFKDAYGSVVFWDSGKTIKESGETHKGAAHLFPQFADHASGMTQILVWTALELEGFGANLQHIGAIPPVEAALKKFLNLPDDYTLKANLNFGEPAQPQPEAPAKLPFDQTLTIYN